MPFVPGEPKSKLSELSELSRTFENFRPMVHFGWFPTELLFWCLSKSTADKKSAKTGGLGRSPPQSLDTLDELSRTFENFRRTVQFD